MSGPHVPAMAAMVASGATSPDHGLSPLLDLVLAHVAQGLLLIITYIWITCFHHFSFTGAMLKIT
jgi:hypothetical protein